MPYQVNFQPQPGPQSALVRCPVQNVCFGGARGGGKTHAVVGLFPIKAQQEFTRTGKEGYKGLVLRPSYPELEEFIDRAKDIYQGIAIYKAGRRQFVFNKNIYGGATLTLSYLDKDKDADKYQGHEYHFVVFEEAGNRPDPAVIYKLKATMRSSSGFNPFFMMTCNPGGRGHAWIKREWVSPAPAGTPFTFEYKVGDSIVKERRVFIPSKLEDNKILMDSDPDYRNRVVMAARATSANLVKAWLEGSWDIIEDGIFADLWKPEIHIIKPFIIPSHWHWIRSYDWGNVKPFSIGWHVISDGTAVYDETGNAYYYPKGTMIRVNEWYGANPETADTGLRLPENKIAEGIKEREEAMRQSNFFNAPEYIEGVADVNIFLKDRGEALKVHHEHIGIYWQQANKGPNSRKAGWSMIRVLLNNAVEHRHEKPGLFIYETCRDFIRLVPTLPLDTSKLDDIDTNAEDHIADEIRYAVMYHQGGPSMEPVFGI